MRVEHDYDVAPRALLEVLTDEAFLAERAARFGGTGGSTVARSADAIVVTLPRRLPLDAIPSALRGFAGSGRLTQTDTWSDITDDRATGDWTADVGSSPLRLKGTHEITAMGSGCRYTVTAEVKVKIPLLGGSAEKLVRERLAELIEKEQDFAEAWLEDSSRG